MMTTTEDKSQNVATEKRLHKQTKLLYRLSILSASVLFALAFIFRAREAVNHIVLERYIIILTIAAIPFALWLFGKQNAKLQGSEKYSSYRCIYCLRCAILSAVFLLNALLLLIFGANNFCYLAIICIFALVFCQPLQEQIEALKEPAKIEVTELDQQELEEDDY